MNVFEMKTSELVAWYNEHSAKPVKKFVNRAVAEERVQKLWEELYSSSKSANIAAGQRRAWAKPEVRAARSERNKVLVDGIEYRSVVTAFKELGLPLSKHRGLRLILKRDKVIEEAFGYKWELV